MMNKNNIQSIIFNDILFLNIISDFLKFTK